jgi:hypothetical protein
MRSVARLEYGGKRTVNTRDRAACGGHVLFDSAWLAALKTTPAR